LKVEAASEATVEDTHHEFVARYAARFIGYSRESVWGQEAGMCFFRRMDLVDRCWVVGTHCFLHAGNGFLTGFEMTSGVDYVDSIARVGSAIDVVCFGKVVGLPDIGIFHSGDFDCLFKAVVYFMVSKATITGCFGMAACWSQCWLHCL